MQTPEELARALGGRKTGGTWMAQCPAHPDKTPSLSISAGNQGGVVFHCHSGCEQARVMDALRSRGSPTHC